jgi:hypothetical protein
MNDVNRWFAFRLQVTDSTFKQPQTFSLESVIARSEATKQSILSLRGEMDCFASLAMTIRVVIPRHRVSPSASPMTGSCGVSSTPWLLGSMTSASDTGSPGHLVRRRASRFCRAMTSRVNAAARSRGAMRPRRALIFRPSKQRAQGKPGARCTRGLVCKNVQKNAHEHTGSAEAIRPSLRNGFTAYAVLSPATNSSCHRRRRIKVLPNPVGLAKPPPT